MAMDVERRAVEAGAALQRQGWSLAVAESCTGGLLGAALTAVAGSSRYFRGGVIAYANEAKTQLLGVPAELLAREGAVSRAMAVAMARGAAQALDAGVGMGITGIAGPDGGTAAKPVGLVYVAVARGGLRGHHAGHEEHDVRELRLAGGREAVRTAAVREALDLLLECLERWT